MNQVHCCVFCRRFSSEKCPTLTVASFLVGAFSLKEKSPTITVSSFFLFFFSWQYHSEWSTFLTICSSFIVVHLPSSTQPESVGSILPLSHKFFNASKSTGETKGSPFWVFFGTMRLFSKILEIYQRVPPCIFLKFSVCRKRWMSLNGLFLSFSALCDLKNTFRKKSSKIIFFENFFFQIFPIVVPWIFLSLRYGADLGRSRLVFFFFVRLRSHSDWATFLTIETTKTTSIRPSPVSGN